MKNKFAIVLFAIFAISALSITACASADPLVSSTSVPSIAVGPISIQQSYTRMDGSIKNWGSDPAMGSIQAQTQTIILNNTYTKQTFASTAIWTNKTVVPATAVPAATTTAATAIPVKENFTYSYYTARLVNGSYAALDFNGNSFFMNGTWNVWNVTISHTVVTDSSGNILSVNNDQNYVALATKAYGELTVASGWTTFSLNITGLEPITGSVYAEITSSKLFNPFALNGDTTVTKTELSSIVRSFGSLPGAASYDQRLDFCQHYKIDICDLATAAANLGQ